MKDKRHRAVLSDIQVGLFNDAPDWQHVKPFGLPVYEGNAELFHAPIVSDGAP